MCPGGMSGGGESQNDFEQLPAKVTERTARPAEASKSPQDHRQGHREAWKAGWGFPNVTRQEHQEGLQRAESRLVLLRKKFEVQQALFEVGAADADADFVTEAVDLVGAAAAQAVFLLFKLEEIRLYVTE